MLDRDPSVPLAPAPAKDAVRPSSRPRSSDQHERAAIEPDPRFTLANERTFLAWNRTALALVGGGLATGQFVEFSSEGARLAVSVTPVVLGALLSIASVRRWHRIQQALRHGEPLPVATAATVVGASIAVLAVTVAIFLVTRIGGV